MKQKIKAIDIDLNKVESKDEELYCSKCGKTISEGEYNDYEGMCATCWHERN